MINEENLNKLYEILIKENNLTTRKLNEIGFNSTDITKLIKDGIIKREARGIYTFCDVEKLFYYGKKLLEEKNYVMADKCFEVCYKLNPEHPGTCFQLFIRSIDSRNYESAFKYFDVIFKTDNVYYLQDRNFYLYLLSIITDVPEKYKDKVYNLTYQDIHILADDIRFANIPAQNHVRSLVFSRKFGVATKELKRILLDSQNRTAQDIITMKLLGQAVEMDIKSMNTITDFARKKNYEEIINFLENKSQRQKLSIIDDAILSVTKQILDVKEKRIIPNIKSGIKNTVFAAIKCNDYDLALRLNRTHLGIKNISKEDNPLNLLLTDLCDLISKFKSENKQIIINPEVETKKENIDINDLFSIISTSLKTANIEEFIISIKNYLKQVKKSEYEFLLIDLFKLSIIQKDYTFHEIITVLTQLRSNNYYFALESFITRFLDSINQNKFDEAKVYLDIIKNSEKLNKKCPFVEQLFTLLNGVENLHEKSKELDNLLSEDIDSLFEIEQLPDLPIEERPRPISNNISELKETNMPKNLVESKKVISKAKMNNTVEDNECQILDIKNTLENGAGIVLLKYAKNQNIEGIIQNIEKNENLECKVVSEDEITYIIVWKKTVEITEEEKEKLISESIKAYNSGDYDTCIKVNLEILNASHSIAKACAKIGLSYLKKHDKQLAIIYLKAATLLDKDKKNAMDFNNVIESLINNTDRKERKRFARITEHEFHNDLIESYGIDCLDEITLYIMQNGIDLESACEALGIDKNQIDLIRIIYARMYYAQKDYEQGDLFVDAVEKSSYKNKQIMKMLAETRQKKRFYAHRDDQFTRKLTINIRPNRKNNR